MDGLINSFKVLPIGDVAIDNTLVWKVMTFSSWMFKEALLISIPAVLSLLVVSLSFGVMARAAPQLNIFSLGFPITLLMGMLVLFVGMASFGSQMNEAIEEGMNMVLGILH